MVIRAAATTKIFIFYVGNSNRLLIEINYYKQNCLLLLLMWGGETVHLLLPTGSVCLLPLFKTSRLADQCVIADKEWRIPRPLHTSVAATYLLPHREEVNLSRLKDFTVRNYFFYSIQHRPLTFKQFPGHSSSRSSCRSAKEASRSSRLRTCSYFAICNRFLASESDFCYNTMAGYTIWTDRHKNWYTNR